MRIILSAVLLLTATSPALAVKTGSFNAEGSSFDYAAEQQADGSIRLTGHERRSAAPFTLVVRDQRVKGQFGANQVDFTVSAAAAGSLAREVGADMTRTASAD